MKDNLAYVDQAGTDELAEASYDTGTPDTASAVLVPVAVAKLTAPVMAGL